MITEIENALVDRLTRGLGQLANTVKSYGGELDDESLGTGRLPMVLVTFGGARIEPMGGAVQRFAPLLNLWSLWRCAHCAATKLHDKAGWINARLVRIS